MKLSRVALIILIIGILLVLIAPFLFTRNGTLEFTTTGQIGDTIGGTTAPITSLIGSILVYLALKAQIRANEIIQEQIDDQKKDEKAKKQLTYISDLYKYFLQTVESFEYDKAKGNGGIIKLSRELANLDRKFAHDDSLYDKGKMAELNAIFRLENLFIEQLNKVNIDSNDKQYFNELIKFHLDSFVLPYINAESEKPQCILCGENHNGFPKKLAELVQKIESNIRLE
ncbi:hypothetical protein [Flavobacterium terrae]|nr:hypothetical protein [Flavobacterium terrae]